MGSFRSLYFWFRKDLSGAEKGKYSDRERGNQREISFFDMFYLCISLLLRLRTCLVHLGKNINFEKRKFVKLKKMF